MTDDKSFDINTPEGLRNYAHLMTNECTRLRENQEAIQAGTISALEAAQETQRVLFAIFVRLGRKDAPAFVPRSELMDALQRLHASEPESQLAALLLRGIQGDAVDPPTVKPRHLRLVSSDPPAND